MTIKLSAAENYPFFVLVDTFNDAYADYYLSVHLDVDSMRSLIERDAIDLAASQLAVDGPEAVGLGMLAIEDGIGWIGGLGVLPAYRRQGIGQRIMERLLVEAQARQVQTVKLEVIEANAPARTLYEALGFKTLRTLLILDRPPASLDDEMGSYAVTEWSPGNLINLYDAFHPIDAPWQRRHKALRRLQHMLSGWAVMDSRQVVAYALGWGTEQIVRFIDMGVLAGYDDALESLLVYLHATYPTATGSFINLDEASPASAIMQRLGYRVTMHQFEMGKTF